MWFYSTVDNSLVTDKDVTTAYYLMTGERIEMDFDYEKKINKAIKKMRGITRRVENPSVKIMLKNNQKSMAVFVMRQRIQEQKNRFVLDSTQLTVEAKTAVEEIEKKMIERGELCDEARDLVEMY